MPRQRKSDLPEGVTRWKERIKDNTFFTICLGRKFTGQSKPIRRRFSTMAEANKWVFGEAQKLRVELPGVVELQKQHGNSLFNLTSTQLAEAASAFQRCEELGMSLTEAMDLAEKYTTPPSGPISVECALEKMLAEKREDGHSEGHLKEMEKKIRRFLQTLPKAKRGNIAAISTMDVRTYITETGKSDGNKKAIKRNLSPLFSWAVANEHMAANPCKGMTVGRRTGGRVREATYPDGEIMRVVRFKVADLRRALQLAEAGFCHSAGNDETERKNFRRRYGAYQVTVRPLELIPWLVLGCFAGLRPDEEATSLTWENIDFDRKQINVPARITKDAQDRNVPMEPSLIEWLKMCRAHNISIRPKNFRRKRQALTWQMGWKEWPEDITRHSYGTYHLAKYKDAGVTAENMGHANPKILRVFYRDNVRDNAEVEAYWKLMPSTLKR